MQGLAVRIGLWWLLLTGGCSSTTVPATGDPRLDLKHEDPRVRIAAAEQIVQESRKDLIQALVENLLDRDGAVRMFTAVALRKLTGKDFDYKPYGTPTEQEDSLREWRAWLAAQSEASGKAGESGKAKADGSSKVDTAGRSSTKDTAGSSTTKDTGEAGNGTGAAHATYKAGAAEPKAGSQGAGKGG